MRPAQRAYVRRLAEWLLGREQSERLASIQIHDEGFGYDVFGFERESVTLAYLLGMPLYRHWFRVESRGIENVPTEGRAILAPNHSGVLPLDGWMIAMDVATKLDRPRILRSMVDYFAFGLPYAGLALTRIGQIAGTRRNFAELMRRGELLCVFPEGVRGTGKLFRDRYQLCRFNVGHVELSLEHQAPIIPTAVIGAEEQAPMLLNLAPVARLLRVPYFPITPTFPWLGLAGMLPLPVKYHIQYGSPLRFWEDVSPDEAKDPEVLSRLAETVQSQVAELIRTGLARRRGVFR
jgi:1-acyl-sn-glycerol-3-phosphate acyltransferase